jgi:RNA polymerase sigma-70 factor (ECF subfamily)
VADVEDRRLLGQVQQGDQDALAALYARHGSAILAYLCRLLDQPEMAEEVLQDTFVGAWHGAARFAGQSTVLAWLFGIARRQAMNRVRRDRTLPVLLGAPEEEPIALGADPATLMQAQLDRDELAEALRSLSPLHREVLGLLLVERLSYAEMAAVLAVPIGTVRSRISNARRSLAVLLREARSEHDG